MFPIFRRGNVPVISSNDVVQDRQDGHHANLWNVLIHCEDDMWLDTGRDNRSHLKLESENRRIFRIYTFIFLP
mgnify:CR=1 FL=1